MLKRLLITLFSLLTITGGHLINRRWDRAVFFFVMVFLVLVWVYAALLLNLNDLESWVGLFTDGWFFGTVLALCVVSAVFTFFDSNKPSELRLGVMGIVGGCGITLMAGLVTLPSLLALTGAVELGGEPNDYADFNNGSYISEYMHFGMHDPRKTLPKPPAGDHWINGRISFEGEAAAGVSLSLAFNDEFRTDDLLTDANGEFRIPVTPGDWQLNFIEVKKWVGGPDDLEVMVLSGHEPSIETFESYWGYSAEPLTLSASTLETEMQLELRIVENLNANWPPATMNYDDDPVSATMDHALAWDEVPNATQYQLQISELKRQGSSSRSRTIIERTLQNVTELALSELPSLPDEQETHEYELSIFAFDAEGQLLTQTGQRGDYRFALPNILIEDDYSRSITEIDPQTAADYRAQIANGSRLEATLTLIDNDMLPAAEALLDKVTEPDDDGQLFALRGYIAAKQGQCAAAEDFFSEAQREGGKNCVPNRYRDVCPVE